MGAATDTLVLFMSASKVRIAQPSNSQQVKSASGQTRGRGQYHENQREQNDDEETGNSLDWMSGAGSKTGTNIFDCMGFVKPILASLVPQPTCYWKFKSEVQVRWGPCLQSSDISTKETMTIAKIFAI